MEKKTYNLCIDVLKRFNEEGIEFAFPTQTLYMANDDKRQTAADFLTFTLTANATVYVAYDGGATALPAWLDDGTWTDTGDTLAVSGGARRLYSKSFLAGSVSLGGNRMSPAAGVYSNYSIIAIPGAPPDTTPPTTTATPPGGTYIGSVDVTLSANEPATIYYTGTL